MPMSSDELRQRLSAIEPNDSMYSGIGPSEVPALRDLLDDEKPWLAARAAHALGRIDSDQAHEVLVSAAGTSSQPEVRVAIAAAARHVPSSVSDEILHVLLTDDDPGVRKFAIKSTSSDSAPHVQQVVGEIAKRDKIPELRMMAEEQSQSMAQQSGDQPMS